MLKVLTSNLIPSNLAIDLSIADDTVLESTTNLEFVLPWIFLYECIIHHPNKAPNSLPVNIFQPSLPIL
jgi:hypothetical protein